MGGGNMSRAVRAGHTVLRDAGPWTPTVHRLLTHLRAQGIDWVPRPLDVRDGREILSLLPGTVPAYPMPEWVWKDAVLTAAAERLARLHAATRDFGGAGDRWQLPAHAPAEVICHNDFAPYNLVFDDEHGLVGVIDWDTASPGPRVWDVAYLAYRLVPLARPGNPDLPSRGRTEQRRRLALLCRAYGPEVAPDDVMATIAPRLEELADFTAARGPQLADHVRQYRADAAWLSA